MTSLPPRLLQLYALRAQVDVLIAAEEQAVPAVLESGCLHPEDKRRDATNMGDEPQFFCLDCRQFVQGRA